jgi:hypothetical protein
MTQEAHAPAADPVEVTMTPTELMEHRLNRVNLALTQLQGLNHNAMSTNINAMTRMQQDVVFCLHVIEKVKEFLPKEQLDQLIGAELPVYQQPSVGRPTLESSVDTPLPVIRQPETHLPPLQPMQEAAAAAQAALTHLGEVTRQAQAEQGNLRREPRSVSSARPTRELVGGQPHGAAALPTDAQQYIGHFIGGGSLFAKYMSPEILGGGKGFVVPGYGGFDQYKEDAQRVAPAALYENSWASGFYRDAVTRLQQFLLMSAKVQVLVVNLPNPSVEVYVSFAPFTERVNIRTLTVQQLQLVYNVIDQQFTAAERLAGQSRHQGDPA